MTNTASRAKRNATVFLKPTASEIRAVRAKEKRETLNAHHALIKGDMEAFREHMEEARVCTSWLSVYVYKRGA